MKNCTVLQHALVQTRLATLRNVETDTETFRRALGQIGLMLLAEALRPLETKAHRVRTPLARTTDIGCGEKFCSSPFYVRDRAWSVCRIN